MFHKALVVTISECHEGVILRGEAGDFTGIELTRRDYVPVLGSTLTKLWLQELPLKTFLGITFVPWLVETLRLKGYDCSFQQQGVRHIVHFPRSGYF